MKNFPDDQWIDVLVKQSLAEDIKTGDVTTALTVDQNINAVGFLVARDVGIVAGLQLVEKVYAELDESLEITFMVDDGDPVKPGDKLVKLEGKASSLLTGERTALNFLQQLSGIASLTAEYVAKVAGTDCKVLDTRKTLPGYRLLAKYAVVCGGGSNHRMGLFDRILMKDNHWASRNKSLAELIENGRKEYSELMIEVEVDTLDQLREIIPLKVDWVLLDNFTFDQVKEALQIRAHFEVEGWSTNFESSGNVNLDTARGFAEAGADAISVGRLTHSVAALDIGMDFVSGEFDG